MDERTYEKTTGKPDIVSPKYSVVNFVVGDFLHSLFNAAEVGLLKVWETDLSKCLKK